LDSYGESLKYVNRLLNAEFGPAARHVPAHMPHLIDRQIMTELQERFAAQFEATSSHRFREPNDMQYAFSYVYFLMHQRAPYNFSAIFHNELDTNHDGELSLNELRTLIVTIFENQLIEDDILNITRKIFYCTWTTDNETQSGSDNSINNTTATTHSNSSGQNATRRERGVYGVDTPRGPITPHVLQHCGNLTTAINTYYRKRLKNK
jgi:hypothetical protein